MKLILSLVLASVVLGCTNSLSEKTSDFAKSLFASSGAAEAGASSGVNGGVYTSPFGKKRDVQGIVDNITFFDIDRRHTINLRAISNPQQVSVGISYGCAIDEDGLKCWGRDLYGRVSVSPIALKNPHQVSVGKTQEPCYSVNCTSLICVIDDEGLKCWDHGILIRPITLSDLKNPQYVSVGSGYICVLDDEGVKCWDEIDKEKTIVPALKNPIQVSAGHRYACAIDDNAVKCWGKTENFQNKMPTLKNPSQISTASDEICAIDDEGVKCWGYYKKFLSLKNPRQISAMGLVACAIDDDGVKCWDNQINIAPFLVSGLKNPKQLSIGGDSCAIDDDGLKCWHYKDTIYQDNKKSILPTLKNFKHLSVSDGISISNYCALVDEVVQCWRTDQGLTHQIDVPTLKNPNQVKVGSGFVCAIDDKGMKCWSEFGPINTPDLKSPTRLSIDSEKVCAIDNDGGHCWVWVSSFWGNMDKVLFKQLNIPELNNPLQISVSGAIVCALYERGLLKCWSVYPMENLIKPINAPSLKNPVKLFENSWSSEACALDDDGIKCWDTDNAVRLLELPKYFYTLLTMLHNASINRIPLVYDALVENMSLTLGLEGQKDALLIYSLLNSTILSMDSKRATETLIPLYDKALKELETITKITDINQIEASATTRKIAVIFLTTSTETAFEFLSIQEREQLQNLVRLLGQATANPMDDSILKALILEFKNQKAIFAKLSASPKSKFLVDTIDQVIGWLEVKI